MYALKHTGEKTALIHLQDMMSLHPCTLTKSFRCCSSLDKYCQVALHYLFTKNSPKCDQKGVLTAGNSAFVSTFDRSSELICIILS